MSADSFEMFVCFCRDALMEDSKPLKFIELIRKRYKECDDAYTQSGEFYELLTLSHAKILNDRANFFVYLKEFLNILKQHKKVSSRSDSLKRAVDTDGTSDSDADFPSKRIKLTENTKGSINDDAQGNEGAQGKTSSSTDERETKSTKNKEYLDVSDEIVSEGQETSIRSVGVGQTEVMKQNKCFGNNDTLRVKQTKDSGSKRDVKTKPVKTSSDFITNDRILECKQERSDTYVNTEELPLVDTDIPHSWMNTSESVTVKHSQHIADSQDRNDSIKEIEITYRNLKQEVEKQSLKSTNEIDHISKAETSSSKNCNLLDNSDSNNSEGEWNEIVFTKHGVCHVYNNHIHYDASSSSEEDSSNQKELSQNKKRDKFWKQDKGGKCNKSKKKKYKISVGQSVSKKESSKGEIAQTPKAKNSKQKSPGRSPKSKSPKSKSPKKKSPIVLITDSESDTDMGKVISNGKYGTGSKSETDINTKYEPQSKLKLKFPVPDVVPSCDIHSNNLTNSRNDSGSCSKVVKVEDCRVDVEMNRGTDKTRDPDQSGPILKNRLKVNNPEENIPITSEIIYDRKQGTNPSKTTENQEKTKKRIPITTEIIYDRKQEANTCKTTGNQENNDLGEAESHGRPNHDSDGNLSKFVENYEENQEQLDEDQDKSGRNSKHSTEQNVKKIDKNRTDQSKDNKNGVMPDINDGSKKVYASTSTYDVDSDNSNSKPKKGSTKQIQRLEKLLEQIRNKIEAVRMKELDMDDLNSNVSDYILEDRLEQKFMKVWKKLCELHNSATSVGRPTEKYFKYEGTRYPDVNRKIEKFINRKKVFPDYQDIRNIIVKVNKDKKLYLRPKLIDDLAKEAFTDVGNKLQHRRQKDFAQNIGNIGVNLYSKYDDPALFNPDLKRKLDANKKIGKSGIEQVVDKYAHLQYEERTGESEEEEEEEEEEADEEEEEEDIMANREQTGAIDTDVIRLLEEDDNCDSDLERLGCQPMTATSYGFQNVLDSRMDTSKDGSAKVYEDSKDLYLGENFDLQKTPQKSHKKDKAQRKNDELSKHKVDINVISIDSDDDLDEEGQFTTASALLDDKFNERTGNILQCDNTQGVHVTEKTCPSAAFKGTEDVDLKKTGTDEINQDECVVIDVDELADDSFDASFEMDLEKENHKMEIVCKRSVDEHSMEGNEFKECIDDSPQIAEKLSSEIAGDDTPLNFKISSPRHISEDNFLQEGEFYDIKIDDKKVNQISGHESTCKLIKSETVSFAPTDDVIVLNCESPDNSIHCEEDEPIEIRTESPDRETSKGETTSAKNITFNKVINQHVSSSDDIFVLDHASESYLEAETIINKYRHKEMASKCVAKTKSDGREAINLNSSAVKQTSKQSEKTKQDDIAIMSALPTNENDNDSKDSNDLLIAVPVNLVEESETNEVESDEFYDENHKEVVTENNSVGEEKPDHAFTENTVEDTSVDKDDERCSNHENVTPDTMSEPEENRLTESVDSCLSLVHLEDLSKDSYQNQYESTPDIFYVNDGARDGNDSDDDTSQCSESLLSDANTSHVPHINDTKMSVSDKLSDPLKCDDTYSSQKRSRTFHNDLVKSNISEKTVKTEKSQTDLDVSGLGKTIHSSYCSLSSSDNEDSELDEFNIGSKVTNSVEKVNPNSVEEKKSVISVLDNAEMIKHPNVRKKLIELENGVNSNHEKDDKSKKSKKDCDQYRKPGSFLTLDDDHFDLIEKYEEPESYSFKPDVIELSDEESDCE